MRKHLERTKLAREMIQVIEAAMSEKERQALHAEMPALLTTESDNVVTVLHYWLLSLQGPIPGSIAYGRNGYVHPSLWSASDMIVAEGYEPHGLFRVPRDRDTLGLSLKGVHLAFNSDLYVMGGMERLFSARHIREAVHLLIFLHRHPELSSGTVS